MMEFVSWLRDFNKKLSKEEKIGIYGMDLYSLHKSMNIIIHYLDQVDIEDANRVRRLYENFLESEGSTLRNEICFWIIPNT
jgi:erythromycin esterase-like protein